jgi:hypothetical protein
MCATSSSLSSPDMHEKKKATFSRPMFLSVKKLGVFVLSLLLKGHFMSVNNGYDADVFVLRKTVDTQAVLQPDKSCCAAFVIKNFF